MNDLATPAKRDFDIEDTTVALLNKSEIEQQIATARKFPRSVKRFLDNALEMVTLSESIAQECIYSLPRDGKVIEGPSARFAEIIVSAWGNSRAGARVVSENGEFVTAQGVFHDLEHNTAITFEVQRRIVNKNGKRYSHDMIGVTANAACSIALRNAILKGVPKAFWADLYAAARRTVMGDFKTLPSRRAAAFEQFQAYGIDKAKIYTVLGIKGQEDIGLEHLVTLGGMLTALKDGDTTPEELLAKAQPTPEPPPPPPAPADTGPLPPPPPKPAARGPREPVQPRGPEPKATEARALPPYWAGRVARQDGEGFRKTPYEDEADIAEFRRGWQDEDKVVHTGEPVAPADPAHKAAFDMQAPPAEAADPPHDPETGEVLEHEPNAVDDERASHFANYPAKIADWHDRLQAASDEDQGEIWDTEIQPYIEDGRIFPPDLDELKGLLRNTG